MSRTKQEKLDSIEASAKTFQAICRVNTTISVKRYAAFKKYSDQFLERLRDDSGDSARLSQDFALKPVRRGEIVTFGEDTIVDEDGTIICYHKEIFESFAKRYVELPCAVAGEIKSTLNQALSLLPTSMRKQLEQQKEILASRFRVEPVFEKYVGQELED